MFEVWKGAADKALTCYTTHNKTTCNGYVINDDKEYLVYSRYNRRADTFVAKLFASDEPTLGVKVYGGTKLIAEAQEDIKFLSKVKSH